VKEMNFRSTPVLLCALQKMSRHFYNNTLIALLRMWWT